MLQPMSLFKDKLQLH